MNPCDGLRFDHSGPFGSSDDEDVPPCALASMPTFNIRNLPPSNAAVAVNDDDDDDDDDDDNDVDGGGGGGGDDDQDQINSVIARQRKNQFAYSQEDRVEDEEIKSLFQYIQHYTPREVVLETLLRPFIPDYIPTIGSVDEFIKVPRPDGIPDFLGLKVLDESGPIQSDPAVVALKIRASRMQSSHHPVDVASIECPERNPLKIDAWIESMRDLHRSKPPSSVTYSTPMPDIEQLLENLPKDIGTALAVQNTDEANESLSAFVDLTCTLLGIPVYKSRVESLHCVFTLFLELKKHSC